MNSSQGVGNRCLDSLYKKTPIFILYFMKKSMKSQFNSAVTIKTNELSKWLQALLLLFGRRFSYEPYQLMIVRINSLAKNSGNT